MRWRAALPGTLALLVAAGACAAPESTPTLRVGVTLPAYYSWAARLLEGTPAEVVPLLPPGTDVHGYQATPADATRLRSLDLVIANGLGHDVFLDPLVSGADAPELEVLDLHAGVPLLTRAGTGPEGPPNPHSFLSLSTAAQQVRLLENTLVRRLPEHTRRIRSNARAYTLKLRKLSVRTRMRLARARGTEVATMHDGYAYLLQELGVKVRLVVQPRHGVDPSAQELANVVAAFRRTGVRVVFAEADFPSKVLELVGREVDLEVHRLHHLNGGAFTPERFESDMESNCKVLVQALVTGR